MTQQAVWTGIYNCPTFTIGTCTSAGGIPLGIVITSGESEEVITEAITFVKAVLPTNAFYGRGPQGPEVCITDDSDAETAALRNTWPGTTLLLCISLPAMLVDQSMA